jgi:hypothetical protein
MYSNMLRAHLEILSHNNEVCSVSPTHHIEGLNVKPVTL